MKNKKVGLSLTLIGQINVRVKVMSCCMGVKIGHFFGSKLCQVGGLLGRGFVRLRFCWVKVWTQTFLTDTFLKITF